MLLVILELGNTPCSKEKNQPVEIDPKALYMLELVDKLFRIIIIVEFPMIKIKVKAKKKKMVIFFLYFYGYTFSTKTFPGLGGNLSCSCRSRP